MNNFVVDWLENHDCTISKVDGDIQVSFVDDGSERVAKGKTLPDVILRISSNLDETDVNMEGGIPKSLHDELTGIIQQKGLICGIKRLRGLTGMGLREAKEVCCGISEAITFGESDGLQDSLDRISSIQQSFAYITDCTLATVERMAALKKRSNGEFERHISIAQQAIDYVRELKINVESSRVYDVMEHGGNVEAWAQGFMPEYKTQSMSME